MLVQRVSVNYMEQVNFGFVNDRKTYNLSWAGKPPN